MFTGNSGVGKSSLLNRLHPGLALEVGEVSEKLGRGRHTTRCISLYHLEGDTLACDTPGFSAFDTDRMPTADQMHLEPPQIVRRNGSCAVRLHASAPSIHLMRADIETELSPVVGDEKQSEDLVSSLLSEYEDDPARLWDTNLFGKSLYELVSEGLNAKLRRMPEDAARKLRQTLTRILNENTGGLICILL